MPLFSAVAEGNLGELDAIIARNENVDQKDDVRANEKSAPRCHTFHRIPYVRT